MVAWENGTRCKGVAIVLRCCSLFSCYLGIPSLHVLVFKRAAAVHNLLNSPTCPKELFGDLFISVKKVIHIFYFVSVQGVIIILVQSLSMIV